MEKERGKWKEREVKRDRKREGDGKRERVKRRDVQIVSVVQNGKRER